MDDKIRVVCTACEQRCEFNHKDEEIFYYYLTDTVGSHFKFKSVYCPFAKKKTRISEMIV